MQITEIVKRYDYTVEYVNGTGQKTTQQTFTATDGQTIFTLSSSPSAVLVIVNEVVQSTDKYTYSSGTLTFDDGLALNDSLLIIKFP